MVDETKTQAVDAKKHEIKPLNETRFQLREYRQECYAVFAEAGTKIEDILTREYWAHVANKMRAPAKICVMEETKAWYAEVIVFVTANMWAEVRLLGTPIIIDRITALPVAEREYVVEDGGLQLLWIVKRLSDGRIIKGDSTLKTKEQAESWLRDWIRAQDKKAA